MPLAETLISNVAPAIAKGILKRWIKDDVGFFTGGGIVDAVKAITTDAFAQQKGKNQFESIGIQVAESLLPIFEVEGGRLDEGSRNAVAATLAEALNKAVITPKLLAEKDLDPTNLARHLKAAIPDATKNYSQDETALYDRLISECSQCIIDIASQLPQFTERTIAEVLRREGQLLDVAKKTLDEVQRIRLVSEKFSLGDKSRRFEEDYCKSVLRTLDKLELFGATLSPASSRHKLSVAYVTLSVRQQGSQASNELHQEQATGLTRAVNSMPISLLRSKDQLQEQKQENSDYDVLWKYMPVDQMLGRSKSLLLRGATGSGKTTLLQWIAVQSASRAFDSTLAYWNDTVPFLIRLRDFSRRPMPRPEDFPSLISPNLAGAMPTGWVHDQLSSGRAIVLVDGVDEVPEQQREQVREWIQDLVQTFPKCRYIVTARLHIDAGWLQRNVFHDAELQPMDVTGIAEFVDHWHNAAMQALAEEKNYTDLNDLATDFKEQVKSNLSIRHLATNPLLCAMLCALHRDRHRRVPESRIALYKACSEMLIHRRDNERDIDLRDYPSLDYEQKRLLLDDSLCATIG